MFRIQGTFLLLLQPAAFYLNVSKCIISSIFDVSRNLLILFYKIIVHAFFPNPYFQLKNDRTEIEYIASRMLILIFTWALRIFLSYYMEARFLSYLSFPYTLEIILRFCYYHFEPALWEELKNYNLLYPYW